MKTLTMWFIVLLGGCTGCTPRQNIRVGGFYDPSIIGVPLDTTTHLGAATICDNHNRPIIIVSTYLQESLLHYIVEHEKFHVKQIEQVEGGCRKFLARYQSDNEFRYRMELEAYCVGYQVQTNLRGLSSEENYPQFIAWLNGIFPEKKYQEIWDDAPCKDGG